MHLQVKEHVLLFVATLAFANISLPSSSRAQNYPIDCAILLCLSGGWPASVPFSRARAEFIRRITPWPVEPPLQIWRCPMGAAYEIEPQPRRTDWIFDVLSPTDDSRPRHSFAAIRHVPDSMTEAAVWSIDKTSDELVSVDFALHLVQERADIDISGPEFNFVRTIRVFDVRFASQREAGENDQCRRHALVYLGTYGTQGEFSWAVSVPAALPDAHIGLEGWWSDCPNINNCSVFVDWRDYEGDYGFEQVNYWPVGRATHPVQATEGASDPSQRRRFLEALVDRGDLEKPGVNFLGGGSRNSSRSLRINRLDVDFVDVRCGTANDRVRTQPFSQPSRRADCSPLFRGEHRQRPTTAHRSHRPAL